MPSKLHYEKAQELAFRVNQLYKDLSDFTDEEDDTVCIDMPDDWEAKMYVDTLAEACIELDRAAQRLGDATACRGV